LVEAVAVFLGKKDSIHLTNVPEPRVGGVPGVRGVLAEVLHVGVNGADKEINGAEYGAAPPGYDFLVTGHESFGRVLGVMPNVRDVERGDYVGLPLPLPALPLGVGLHAAYGRWWAEPMVALAMLPVLLWRGLETLGEAGGRRGG
jgi:threonine dehydrogenase-like Zn-dependent dehydrogenase